MIREVREPTREDLARARAVVAQYLRPTPVVTLALPDGRGELFAKLETMQPTGAFKVRGALAALSAVSAARPGARVVAASAGSHGLGVALWAARFGVPATIVVPATASPAKVAALRGFDADLVQYGEGYDETERHALGIVEDGAVYVSPYNDPIVIAGQSTVAAEVGEQVPGPLTIVVPVGGGGLLAGTALWAKDRPDVRVVGVEAEVSRGMSTAVAQGRIVEVPVGVSVADALTGNLEPGSITPKLATGRVDDFVAVSDPEIEDALRWLALHRGLVVEGAAAAGVAAVLTGKVRITGTCVVLLTGRNITAATLCRVLTPSAPS